MLEKLQAVEDKYMELESLISDPDTIQDIERWQRYSKEHASLTPLVEKFRVYKKVVRGIADDKAMFAEPLDDEMRKLVEEELPKTRIGKLKRFMLPDILDDKVVKKE